MAAPRGLSRDRQEADNLGHCAFEVTGPRVLYRRCADSSRVGLNFYWQ